MNAASLAHARRAFRGGLQDQLPPRYEEPFYGPFQEGIASRLRPGMELLDVGGGRAPSLAPALRPPGCRYTGLDSSPQELDLAPPGSYDECVVADAAAFQPELHQRFDLLISLNVLEHIRALEPAMRNFHSYLKPEGSLVAQLPGRFSAFAILNRMIPDPLGSRLVSRVAGRPRETVFPAYYDRCYREALGRLLTPFRGSEIISLYCGAGYFRFSRPLLAGYLAYEELIFQGGRSNLASHYVIRADA